MSGYFAEAGVVVADPAEAPPREPPGPAELAEISARWSIEFWTGPVDPTPPPRGPGRRAPDRAAA
jgi:hypothetical protein